MRRRLRDGRDGRALVEELERIGQSLAPSERCPWFLELGVACESLVPERHRAIAVYQQAWEADPSHVEALSRARALAAELGRMDEFVAIVELELQRETDEARAEQLAVLIAEALLDAGDRQRAAGFLVRAVTRFPASALLQDGLGTVGHDDDWSGEVERLIEIGEQSRDPELRVRVWSRAARILRITAPDDPRYEPLLRRVLKCDPYNDSASRLLEVLLTQAKRWEDVEALEHQQLASFPGADEQAFLCQRFAFKWHMRGDDARAVVYIERAVELGGFVYPIAALTLLRGIYAPRRQWRELLGAIDAVLSTPMEEDAVVHAALLAGTIAWRALDDLERAASYFERVRRVATDSLPLIDFDDAVNDRRNPEAIGDEQRALMEAARKVGRAEPVDRAVDAWKRAIAADPSRRAPRRALARLLRQSERWRALADALKDEETHACRDPVERVALLLQIVAVYRDRLRQDILAIQGLSRVLEIQPGNLAALDQVEALHESMGRWSEVVATLQRKLKHVEDTGEQVQLHLRLSELYRERLGNESESLRELDGALALDPAQDQAAARLEEAYLRRREWDKLIALKRRRLPLVAEPEQRLERVIELAQLTSEKLRKPADAIAAWRSVLELAPDHDGALSALEKLHSLEKEFLEVAQICARRADLASDPATKVQHLQKAAGLYGDELHDPVRAIEAWRTVLALAPTSARAQEKLKRLYVGERRWADLEELFAGLGRLDECVTLFERQADEEEGAERIELWRRVGLLYRDRLDKSASAMRAFEKLLALEPHHLEAAEALIPLYEQAHEHKRLAGALTVQLEHTDEPTLKKARLERLARLCEAELDEKVTAFRWQLQAFELDPADGETRARLERLAQATSVWPLLIEAYQRAAPGLPPHGRVPLLQVVATEQHRVLGDAESSLATWRSVLELDPESQPALDALERLYADAKRYDELQSIYARKLELTRDGSVQLDLWCKMAALAEDKGDDARALAAYRGVLEVSGDEPRALAALHRILERRGEWQALEEVLLRERALPDLSGADRRALTLRLAEVREHHLDAAAAAIELYREILTEAPDQAEARAGLERYLARPGHELSAALLLEPIYERRGETERLVEVREVRVTHSESSETKLQLLHTIARMQETGLARAQAAFETLSRALRIAPADRETMVELERIADLLESWAPLVELYREIARRSLSIEEHVELRCRLARLYRDRLDDKEKAAATYARVLDLAADHAEAEGALDALQGVLGRWRELAERLRADLERDPTGARARVRRDAVAGLRRALGDDRSPATLDARLVLARIDQAQGDDAAAEKEYQLVLAVEPDRAEALAGLDELYARAGRHADRAEILRRRISARAGDPLRLAIALAQLEADTLGDLARARQTYQQALTIAPDEPEALRGLARIAEGDEVEPAWRAVVTREPRDPEALAALALHYEQKERWPELAEVLERQLVVVEGSPLEPALAEQLALVASRLGDGARALSAWQRVARLSPDSTTPLRALAKLHRDAQRTTELAQVLAAQLELPSLSPAEIVRAGTELGALETSVLGRVDRAIAAWKRVLAADPHHEEAMAALEALYAQSGDRSAPIALVEQRAVAKLAAGEPAQAVELFLRAAAAWEAAGTPERAVASWERVLAIDPHHALAATQLEGHHRARGEWNQVANLLRERARSASSPEQKGEAWRELARVEEAELGDPLAAMRSLLQAFALDGRWSTWGDELRRLARLPAIGDAWRELVTGLRRRSDGQSSSSPMQPELYLAIGELHEAHGEDKAAIEAYRAALILDDGAPEVLDHLEAIYRRTSNPELLDVLGRRAEATLDRDQKVRLLEEIARGAAQQGRWVRAVGARRRCAEAESLPRRRGQHLFEAGLIYQDQLASFEEAYECFDGALKCFGEEGAEPPPELVEAHRRLLSRNRSHAQTLKV
jgi:tetratricopeptide (TPR) repeat protein